MHVCVGNSDSNSDLLPIVFIASDILGEEKSQKDIVVTASKPSKPLLT